MSTKDFSYCCRIYIRPENIVAQRFEMVMANRAAKLPPPETQVRIRVHFSTKPCPKSSRHASTREASAKRDIISLPQSWCIKYCDVVSGPLVNLAIPHSVPPPGVKKANSSSLKEMQGGTDEAAEGNSRGGLGRGVRAGVGVDRHTKELEKKSLYHKCVI